MIVSIQTAHVEISVTVHDDESFDAVVRALRTCALGAGYAIETINDYLPEPE